MDTATNAWFRNSRGELYVVGQTVLILAVAVAPLLDGGSSAWWQVVIGLVLCLAGLSLLVSGSVGLGHNLSPLPKPKDGSSLVTGGVFAIVRHPIYGGFVFISFGWSLIWSSVLAAIIALVLLVFFDFKARREERWLGEKFADYAEYRQHTKKLIPFLY